MTTAEVTLVNPGPAGPDCAFAEVLDGERVVAEWRRGGAAMGGYEALIQRLCGWLRRRGVSEAVVYFVAVGRGATSGQEKIAPLGQPFRFNPLSEDAQLDELVRRLQAG